MFIEKLAKKMRIKVFYFSALKGIVCLVFKCVYSFGQWIVHCPSRFYRRWYDGSGFEE